MVEALRKSGIDIIGDVPWGTHFCLFYRNKDDLLEMLVPYFKAGLENNEFCMWVTSEPLGAEEARRAMAKAMPDFPKYLKKKQIEIIPYTEWYIKGDTFKSEQVLNGWVGKLNQALAKGFAGLRLTDNTFWLERNGWQAFTDYEEEVNNVIGQYQMMAICTYSLEKCSASEVVDVVRNHQFALIRQPGQWEFIESSEYKKTKGALEEANLRLTAILESISDGFFTMEGDLTVTYFNRAAEKLLNRKREEVLGRNLFEAFPEAKGSIFEERYTRALKEKKPDSFETYFGIKPYENWYDVRVYPYENGISVFFQVITERKKAGETLKQSEEKYRSIVETSSEGIWMSDADGKTVFINQKMADMLGYTREEIIGRAGAEFLTERQEELGIRIRRELAEGEKIQREFQLRRKDGSILWMLTSGTAIFDEKGKHIGNLYMHTDITERKKAEGKTAYLASFPELNPMLVVEIDAAGNLCYLNPSAKRTFPDLEKKRLDHPFLSALKPEVKSLIKARGSPTKFEIQVGERYYEQVVSTTQNECLRLYCQDITERKQAEEGLRRANEELEERVRKRTEEVLIERQRLWRVLETLPAMICLLTPDHHVTFANRASRESFGESRGRHCYEYRFGRTEPCDFCEAYKVLETGKPQHWEVRAPDGTSVIDAYAFPFIDVDGSPMVLEMDIDITEQRRAEEALRQSEEKFSRAFHGSPAALRILDLETAKIIDANENFARLIGFSREEIIGRTSIELGILKRPEGVAERRRTLMEEGKIRDYEIEIITRTGEERICELSSDVIELGGRKVSLSTLIDVTEQRRAEAALKELNETLEQQVVTRTTELAQQKAVMDTILENTGAMLVYLDRQFNFVRVNQAYVKASGHKPEELLGRNHFDLFPNAENQAIFEKVRDTGEPIVFHDKPFVYPDQPERGVTYWDWSLVPVKDAEGKMQGLVFSLVETTERVRAEQQLAVRERLATLGELAGSISHEIRNPLATIDSSVFFLTKALKDTEGKVKAHLERIHSSVQRATSIIQSLLDLTRMEKPKLSSVDLKTAVAEAIAASEPPPSVKIVKEFPADKITVAADRQQFQIACRNLITNAVQAMGKGGTLTVTITTDDNEAELAFADTGPGIPLEAMGKLFTPLFTTKAQGIGFGLPITKMIVERHGGKISAKTEAGKGVIFIIRLPLRSEGTQEVSPR